MKLFATVTAAIGAFLATVATAGCIVVYLDEPEMPESLLKFQRVATPRSRVRFSLSTKYTKWICYGVRKALLLWKIHCTTSSCM